jgi:hypothetical protein
METLLSDPCCAATLAAPAVGGVVWLLVAASRVARRLLTAGQHEDIPGEPRLRPHDGREPGT